MKSMKATFITEWMKVRRTNIFWITVLIFMFVPSLMGLMMFVAKNPEMASKLGMIGSKATMLRVGKADWPAYLELLTQTLAGIGMVGFGFVTSWIFGREFSDRTIKDILALPVSRNSVVISKFIIGIIWCFILTLVLIISGTLIGHVVNLSGWSSTVFISFIKTIIYVSLLTMTLNTPVAFLASYSRGYLLPMGFVILTMILANFTGLVGLGPYFPWAIPGLLSVPENNEGMQLLVASYIILLFVSIAGLVATLYRWRFADQH